MIQEKIEKDKKESKKEKKEKKLIKKGEEINMVKNIISLFLIVLFTISCDDNDSILGPDYGTNTLELYSTVELDKNGYYHFKVREDNKLISNHHMFSSVSKGTRILNNDDLKVGKYRTTYIVVPDGNHKYELELIEPLSQAVYFRFED